MAELESQANKNRETGYLGLEEVKKLRDLGKKIKFRVVFKGKRPTEFEIKHAKSGEIDSVIRHLAAQERATLVTADKVQSLVAESKGLNVLLYEFEQEEKPFVLEKYFDKNTMSVHLKAGLPPYAKKGAPGDWHMEKIRGQSLNLNQVEEIAMEIIENVREDEHSFIEIEK